MTDRPTILLPIRVLKGESIPEGVPELLAKGHVILLGYHVIPEQTAPGQAQMEFEDRGNERLDTLETMLTDAGATVERRLVFTHHGQKTIDRLIDEHECQAVLVPNATGAIEDVLVPTRGHVATEHFASVVAGLFAATEARITVYHVLEEDESPAAGQEVVDDLRDHLVDLGIDANAVQTTVEDRDAPREAIVDVAGDFDVVVMGESDPSLATFVFGMAADQVAERFLGPVVVVQRERSEDTE